ncbi:putative LRR receptor-like serine/threonine-protein kinase [Hibiscus syriacus]|uniref:LRR receptor-like serine/threonine-protein kinase n=2 Tax=Hibiscus syriacus TaxID=106335 RepID=A0A6A3A286_HIBSY|nr:probable LRR receptor-like serine/threonine-protein kinase At1g63430 isoform X1 [Hibiscus syriacus]KAE8698133.1 putative LRR receptor-like serine/threonine-protein kinase [Hibiscus syriacus]
MRLTVVKMGSYTSFLLIFLAYGVYCATCATFPTNEVRALTSFKEAIYEDPNLVFSNWNAVDADPCGWTGITCNKEKQHVIKINISDSSLKGFLAPEIERITYLQELTLRKNNLIGTIPEELGLLNFLELLDLGMNQLTGIIPPELGNLTSVVKINLQSNGLTGRLPGELGKLKFLQELILDRNKLQGTVPAESNSSSVAKIHGMIGSGTNLTGLCRATLLKVVDLSFNFFVGSIPNCLENLPSTSFQGNCLQGKEAKQRPLTQCGPQPTRSHKSQSPKHSLPKAAAEHLKQKASKPAWLLALEIATGIMVGFLFLIAVLTAFLRCYRKPAIIIPWKKSGSEKEHLVVYVDSEMLKDVTKFGRQDLEVACEDFSNIIGSSPDSVVYKGTMKGGPEIAVISFCIKEQHWTGYLELYFQREVSDLARLNHENVGKLLGYCKDSTPFTRMLVFEYASNGTLYEHLHYGEGSQLSWTRRMRIILGIARGLMYLHTELDPPFTISELNSSAVYLTEDFSPKLVDFESWKTILARSEKNSGSIGSSGSICLLPNSLENRHLDIQGNIHDFGILLLEIISGKPPFCKEKGCLIDWAREYLELPEVMSYIVDPELKHFSYDDLKVVCEVISLCIHPDFSKRPSMKEISLMLESRIDTSLSVELKTSLAWAELALSS